MTDKENPIKTGHMARRVIVCTVFAVLVVLLYMQIGYELGIFYLGPKIKGSVMLHNEAGNIAYEFDDPNGGYGWYEWTVGTDEVPIDIYLFNKNGWQITRLDLNVTPNDHEWLITGKISSNRFQRKTYESRVPLDERIRIDIEFY